MNISIGVCSLLTSHFVTLIACPFFLSLSLSLSLSLFYNFGLITRSDRLVRSFRSEFSFIENACNPQETQRQPTAKSWRCPFLPSVCASQKTNCHLYSPGQSIFDQWAAAAAPIVIDVLVYLHVVFSRLSVFSSSFWIKSQTKTKTNSARLVS